MYPSFDVLTRILRLPVPYQRFPFLSLCIYFTRNASGSPFCINVYPFFAREHCSRDFSLFGPNEGYPDGEGGRLRYTNMFDAQVRF